jgi:hypothetical protein
VFTYVSLAEKDGKPRTLAKDGNRARDSSQSPLIKPGAALRKSLLSFANTCSIG